MTNEERELKSRRIDEITQILTSPVSEFGDWKIIKYMEYNIVGEELPYDMYEFHEQREALRNEIRALKEELGI